MGCGAKPRDRVPAKRQSPKEAPRLFLNRFGDGVTLNQLNEFRTLIPPKRCSHALGAGLMDVIQKETVEGAGIVKAEKMAFRRKILMAVNVAHGYAAADGISAEGEKSVFVSACLPLRMAFRCEGRVALAGVNVFDDKIVIPARSGTCIVIADDDGMMTIRAVEPVDSDRTESVILAGEQTDSGVAVASGEIVDVEDRKSVV